MRCDLTWLTSSYTCIFGQGCQGIYASSPGRRLLHARRALRRQGRREAGRGVRRRSSTRRSGSSSPTGARSRKKDWIETDDEGERKTRTVEVDGQQACVFHNRADFPTGAGCALHGLALAAGPQPARDQARRVLAAADPAARSARSSAQDGTTYTEVSIGEYDRRGWGPGGHDLDWYCSGNTEAHVAAGAGLRHPRARAGRADGQAAYDELVRHCEAHVRSRSALALHPADPH